MRRMLPYVAALLVYVMTPAAGEVVENAVHLVLTGHTAHALHDGAHQPDSPEHGCSGPFHICHCHSSVSFTAPCVAVDVGAPFPRDVEVVWFDHDVPSEAHRDGVFRPPIA